MLFPNDLPEAPEVNSTLLQRAHFPKTVQVLRAACFLKALAHAGSLMILEKYKVRAMVPSWINYYSGRDIDIRMKKTLIAVSILLASSNANAFEIPQGPDFTPLRESIQKLKVMTEDGQYQINGTSELREYLGQGSAHPELQDTEKTFLENTAQFCKDVLYRALTIAGQNDYNKKYSDCMISFIEQRSQLIYEYNVMQKR
ncbi:hypothetical protein [Carnimonas nigrificans]|uniref:hypothetical protein n=1 Tax=Carnimonas nigrificans TaxID=64323 RepID=UPI00046FADE6|nr:hypothetical protein [Carnimonas nigrificans]